MTPRLLHTEVNRSRVEGARWIVTAYVLTVPLLAAVGVMRGDRLSISGMNYTGFLWLAALAAGVGLFIVDRGLHPLHRVAMPFLPWLAWLGLVVASTAWTEDPDYEQIRDTMQMCLPLLIGVTASLFIRTQAQLKLLIRAFYFAVPIMLLFVVAWAVLDLDQTDQEEVYVEVRGLALTAVIIGGLFIASTPRYPASGWAGWVACLLLTVVTGSRMASAAMLLLPIINPIMRSLSRRMLAVGAVGLITVAVVATPIFQERFFKGEKGGLDRIAAGDFDSAGRFQVWPIVLDEALQRPWLGHGANTVQNLIPLLWQDVVAPHNDYLRIGYELGIVGLVVFLSVMAWQLWSLFCFIRRTDGLVQQAAAAAWMGLIAFLPIAYTDNPIMYTLGFMNPIFVLIGAAYGVERVESEAALPAPSTAAARRSVLGALPRVGFPHSQPE